MTYTAKPYDQVHWTMSRGLWATCKGDTIIDVYESRELAEAWVAYANRTHNDKGYEVFDARKYRHVAAIMSNGQRTARWSQDKTSGQWFVSKGWKIPNRR